MISPRLYAIVPRTLYDRNGNNITMTCGRMAAQVAHIMGALAIYGVDVPETDLIILQVPNSKELESLREKLIESSVDFLDYSDTNKSYDGSICIVLALHPIERGSCMILRELKPWVCACNL